MCPVTETVTETTTTKESETEEESVVTKKVALADVVTNAFAVSGVFMIIPEGIFVMVSFA